jgi:transposase
LRSHFHTVRDTLPEYVTAALQALFGLTDGLSGEVEALEKRILDWHKASDTGRRLATAPSTGPITASEIAASVPDPSLFRPAHQFAAWLGLTPRSESSGGKDR